MDKILSENEIVSLLVRKDLQGMEALYEQYGKYIFGIIKQILKREDLAELVLQDTFLKVWDKIDSFSFDKGKLLTWMMNIARNAAIDMTRSKDYKQSLRLINLESADQDKITLSNVQMENMDIKDLVSKLDNRYNVLIQLVYFQGYTHVEVANELGIPLGTVKSRIRKAFTELRLIIEG